MKAAAIALMLASGFAGLGWQIVWTQQCGLWLGHESAAVLAVLAAFFGGLALGALALGPRIERSAHPGRWYAGCEFVIAAWGGILVLLMAPATGALLALAGTQPSPVWQWGVAFGGCFVLLLPATAAMGATLPAMNRLLAGRQVAALYAANTFGAVLGVLVTAFGWVPGFGLTRTALLCAALNLLCALAALRLFAAPAPAPAAAPAPAVRGLPWRLAATGLLGIGYEVLVVRVLSQVNEDTVYTFALLLAVYLVGSAAGAAAWQRWRRPTLDDDALADRLLAALALACLLGTGSLWGAEAMRAWLLDSPEAGMRTAVAAEGLLALLAFGLPTLVMGALFSHLASMADRGGIGFGRALGINTLGAAVAPLLFGVLLAPLLGAKPALLLVAAGYLLLLRPSAWRWAAAPAAAALGLALLAPPLVFVDVPPGGRVLSYREGALAAVSVVEDAAGVKRLRIDNRQQEGSSASALVDSRQALLPRLLQPSARHALFLGLGTGVTAAAAAADPALQVDAVELLPEVIQASELFIEPSPRLRRVAADARRFVRTSSERYDLVVADNFHPARSGSGALYTVEHFRAVQQRLADGGLFCQWLPLHQLDLGSLRSIVRSFVEVYPGATAILASNSLETPVLGLLGRRGGERFELARLREGLLRSGLPQPPARFGIEDDFALLGSFVGGPDALRRFAGDAPLNTDDRPVVAYSAPRITYAPDSLPRDRLLALLDQISVAPADVLAEGSVGGDWPARLAAYWQARRRFLDAGRDVRPSSDPRTMLAQVQAPLLAVLRTSPDFRPAYDPLLRLALALARQDGAAAGALLAELAQAQPARQEAMLALAQLGQAPPP